MASFCPSCGTEFPLDLSAELSGPGVRCSGCRLVFTDVAPALTPAENEDEEIGYELTDWSVGDRGQASALLIEHDIPYRWEAGLVLVVPVAVEEQVDGLLDGLDPGPGEEPSPGGGEGTGEDEDLDDDAQTAMAELFVAADRLQHQPFDSKAGSDLRTAAAVVAGSRPPYGIEGKFWSELSELAGVVVAGLDQNVEDDQVASDARALRDVLRDYV